MDDAGGWRRVMACSQICCVSVGLGVEVRHGMGEFKVRLEVSVERCDFCLMEVGRYHSY